MLTHTFLPLCPLPRDLVGGATSLELPDVGAQDDLALVPWVVEGLGVVSVPLFPRWSRDMAWYTLFLERQ